MARGAVTTGKTHRVHRLSTRTELISGNRGGVPGVICVMTRLRPPYRLLRLALLAALLPAAACARTTGTGAGGPSAPDSGPAAATTAPATTEPASPVDGCPDGLRTGRVSLSETDDGKQVCLATGTALEVYLRGSTDSKWSAPTPDGTALRPTFNGKGALQVGVTAGFFVAAAPGVVHLTAQRAACPSPPSGGVACQALIAFRVTVTVR